MNPKLNKWTRSTLEQLFRERQQAAAGERGQALSEHLRAHVIRRLEAEYRPIQGDMPILQKYHCASRITGVNVDIYNPETQRYDERAGFRVETDLLAPDPGRMHFGETEATTYVSFHVRPDDLDHADFWQIVEYRRNFQTEQKQARESFAQAIRATSSWRRIVEQFPWISEATHGRIPSP